MITPPRIAEAIAAIRELQVRCSNSTVPAAFDYDKVVEGLIQYAAACLLVDNRLAAQNSEQVAEARIYDSISWFMKGSAQLRVCNNPEAHRIADMVDEIIIGLWNGRDILALGGNDDQKTDPHRIMVSHALMNAAGHALYAGERTAAMNLAQHAMEEWRLLNAKSRN